MSSFAVVPLTTRIRRIPTCVLLDPDTDPITDLCVVSLDHIQATPATRLVDPIGQLSTERMAMVDVALHFALGVEVCPAR